MAHKYYYDKTFVYALTNNHVIFYVGRTNNIYSRFGTHFCDVPCCHYIKEMLLNSITPDLLILAIYDNNNNHCSIEVEKRFIKYFASINQKLCNTEHNNVYNIFKTTFNPVELPKAKYGLRSIIIENAITKYLNENK